MSIPTDLLELLDGTSENPERVLEYLTDQLLPRAVKMLNEEMLPRAVPFFPGDSLPTNQRNLTDVRTRLGVLLEYEFAKAVTASLPAAVQERGIDLTYVVANQFPDLAFRAEDGRIGVRFEVKAIEATAEEKSANFSTLIKDIRKDTDFVVIMLWEWTQHRTEPKHYPHVDSFFVMNAYQLAQMRDCNWLNNPPDQLNLTRQGFDLSFAVNATGNSLNREEGNLGKLMRIFDPKHEDKLPNSVAQSKTLDTYYRFSKCAVQLGLNNIGRKIAEEAQARWNSAYTVVSASLPICLLVDRNQSRLVILGDRHMPSKKAALAAIQSHAADLALLLNGKFQWTVRDTDYEIVERGRKPAEAITWVTGQ